MPNFRPDTGGRSWSLVQVASSIALREGAGAAFPVSAAQAPGCSIWSMPYAVRGSGPRVFHKSVDSAATVFCAFPARGAQAARSLTGALSPGVACLLPSVVPASVSPRASRVHGPCVSPRLCRRMLTIQYLRKSLVRNWKPICSAVGVLGAEPAPFPSLLPPASGGAGPVRSRLAPLDLLGPFVL